MNTCELQFIKHDGKLIPSENIERFKLFKESLPDNTVLDASFEVVSEERSYEQIKKIHKLFRIIAEYTGHTVEEIKLYMKLKAGYAYETEIEGVAMVAPLKSIGKMSKKDLSDFIEFTINYATMELNLIVE